MPKELEGTILMRTSAALASIFVAPVLVVGCSSPAGSGTAAGGQRFDALANLPFEKDRPTVETAQKLRDELLFQRASQIYLWALAAINTYGMKDGSEQKFGAGYNVLPVFKKRLDANTLITTPNSDVLYALSYVDVGKD